MNTNQTIDAQCAELADEAEQASISVLYFRCDAFDLTPGQRALSGGINEDNIIYCADRIIALRTLEAAQQAQAVRS